MKVIVDHFVRKGGGAVLKMAKNDIFGEIF